MAVTVDELVVADPVDAWVQAGFSVDSDVDVEPLCRIGDVRIRFGARDGDAGIVGWSLRGLPPGWTDVDGVPTTPSETPPAVPAAHPNGVTDIDHVVMMSPDLGRTVNALAGIGLEPRRQRDADIGGRPIRQIFFRLGAVILEVVGSAEASAEGPSELWGITYVVADIDATAERLGDRTSPVKPAVQPGRRITTLRHREFGMSVRTAFISSPILGT